MTATGGTPRQLVLELTGDVDALSQDTYRTTVDRILADGDGDRFVIDMTDVVSIDSSGLGLLVHIQAATREKGIDMVLTHVPPRAGALLKRTGLDRVFEIDGA